MNRITKHPNTRWRNWAAGIMLTLGALLVLGGCGSGSKHTAAPVAPAHLTTCQVAIRKMNVAMSAAERVVGVAGAVGVNTKDSLHRGAADLHNAGLAWRSVYNMGSPGCLLNSDNALAGDVAAFGGSISQAHQDGVSSAALTAELRLQRFVVDVRPSGAVKNVL